MDNADLTLKIMPPRVPKHFVVREHLQSHQNEFVDKSILAVVAPSGFGKTSMLSQWRREYLKRGSVVTWLTLDKHDDAQRLVRGIALAMRQNSARGDFAQLYERRNQNDNNLEEALTGLLAEIADLSVETVLILDEIQDLPPQVMESSLAYIIFNRPQNLKIILASRHRVKLPLTDILARGEYLLIGVDRLRFSLQESIDILQTRFGQNISPDYCAKLHDISEGWPLGLQLAVAAIEQSSDLPQAISQLSACTGDIKQYFVENLLGRLPEDVGNFLINIAIVDAIHPDLCVTLTGHAQVKEMLAFLLKETPIFIEGTESEWFRIHPLALEFLRERTEALPLEQRQALHMAASTWLDEHDMKEEAARHAYAAGRVDLAHALVRSCLYEMIVQQGHFTKALKWIERFSETEFHQHPWLKLALGWTLATGEHYDDAIRLVSSIADDQTLDKRLRFEATAIMALAHFFGDRIDETARLLKSLAGDLPIGLPRLDVMLACSLAMIEMCSGQPKKSRLLSSKIPAMSGDFEFDAMFVWNGWVIGSSYFWEGQMNLAESHLIETLRFAERSLGRRAQFTVMVATLLAGVYWRQSRPADVASLLANRLDIIERRCPPDTLIMGYVLAARLADAGGDEARAFDILHTLYALGEERQMPRLCISSLMEQIVLHSRHDRQQTSQSLLPKIDELMAELLATSSSATIRTLYLYTGITHLVELSRQKDWAGMLALLDTLENTAQEIGRGCELLKLKLLRALAMQHLGEDVSTLVRETLSLARLYGLKSIIRTLPTPLKKWDESAEAASIAESQAVGATQDYFAEQSRATLKASLEPGYVALKNSSFGKGLLTPKEGEVLLLLARSMSNKEIALALEVSEQTVKWHLKNLFVKLNAGSRKHVVNRARMLGVFEAA